MRKTIGGLIEAFGVVGFLLGAVALVVGALNTGDAYYRSIQIGIGVIVTIFSLMMFSLGRTILGDETTIAGIRIYKVLLWATIIIMILAYVFNIF